MLRRIGAALDEGNNVAVDCRQGVGRSGLIAAGVLVATGTGWEKAIDTVSTSRGLSIPETREQLQWLEHLASELRVEAS